ncbi:MAG TPA: 50S ribosomal protein L35 [Candidatus Kapabacteria bacterium]
MPKMKTKSGAKKRFKMTGSGQIKRERAFQAHIMTSKSKKRKRSLRQSTLVAKANEKSIRILLGV